MRYEIWSEAQEDRIFSSWSLSDTLQAWDELGCQHPGEKMFLVNSREIDAQRYPLRGSAADMGELSPRQLINELEILQKEAFNGFEVTRFYRRLVDDALS